MDTEIENEPRWRDGYPQNLPAAALDGLEWLRVLSYWMQRDGERYSDDSRCKINRTIEELEKHLGIGLE